MITALIKLWNMDWGWGWGWGRSFEKFEEEGELFVDG
jgi:hypothetical protein